MCLSVFVCVFVCVFECVYVCVCVRVCMCVWGISCATSSFVVPGYWVTALLMAWRGSVGLASQSVPCSSFASDGQKLSAFKTKNTVCKSKSRGFLHAKSRTRLACWNVQSAGALSLKLQNVIQSTSDKTRTLTCWLSPRHAGRGMEPIESSIALLFIQAPTPLTLMELLLPYLLAHALPGKQLVVCPSPSAIE